MVFVQLQLNIIIMNATKKIIVIFLTSFSFGCQNINEAHKEQSIPDMLEQSLSSVVTIKITSTGMAKNVFGFASDSTNKSQMAYNNITEFLSDAESVGSGFAISYKNKKYIITNTHVVDKSTDDESSIVAISYSRKEYPLHLVGGDSFYDIAVLELKDTSENDITTLAIDSNDFRVGDDVFAIGNPLGSFPYSVTEGIISAKNRPGITAKFGYLQSSAMISRGNSGGPLLNKQGEIVGVNTLGVEKSQQLNFALEAKILRKVVEDIVNNNGRVRRAYLGFEVVDEYQYETDTKGNYNWKRTGKRPVVSRVFPNSPSANQLNDFIGDEIIEANGKEINSANDLLGVLENMKPNDTLNLELASNDNKVPCKIISDELTKIKLAEIASNYFKEHFGIAITQDDKLVKMEYPFFGYKNNCYQIYDPQNEKFIEYLPKGETSYIIAFGNTSDIEDLDFWRVRTLADVGVALKLSGLDGQLSFIEYDGRQKYISRVLICDKKDRVNRTLIY